MIEEIQIKTLRTLSEIEEIRPAWGMWPGNRDSDLDYYLTCLRSSPETVRPHVIVISRGGQPDAILVGRIDRKRILFRVGYLRFKVKAELLYFVYGALRGNASAENSELFVREIRRSLSQGDADAAYLNFLRPDSPIYTSARTLPGFLWRDHMRTSQSHYTRTLVRGVDEFHRELSPKLRRNQRWKKLVQDFPGAVKIRCFREAAELETLIHDAERIMKNSYQRGLGVGFRDTAEERERLQLKAENGWLRGYVLYIADRPCAFWMGDINQGIFGSDYLAFDPAFGKYSPGLYLIFRVIEGFCGGGEDEVTGVDFATGHAEYKEAFSNGMWEETCLYIFAPSWRGLALNFARTLTGGIDKALKWVLDHTGLLQKIKRAWRARLRLEQAKASQPSEN